MLSGLSDSRSGLILPEHFQRRRNRVMLFHAATQATQQCLLEQLKPFGSGSGLTKPLSKPTDQWSPKCFQIDVCVGQIACRVSEKRKGAARFEVNPDDKRNACRIGSEAAPKRS